MFRSLRPDFIETSSGAEKYLSDKRVLFRSLRPDFIETFGWVFVRERVSLLFRSLRPDFIETTPLPLDPSMPR